jgi:hypothetical protein
MSTDYLGYLYGSAVAAGGAMGYIKKRQEIYSHFCFILNAGKFEYFLIKLNENCSSYRFVKQEYGAGTGIG